MDANDSIRIDQDIPSELKNIAGHLAQASAAGKQLDVCPPGGRPPDMPQPSPLHPVGAVQPAGFVDQNRPVQPGVANVIFRERATLESHDSNPDAQSAQLTLFLPQLRQVLSARQSSQMPVEHQHQPVARKVLLTVHLAAVIAQLEGHCFLTLHGLHSHESVSIAPVIPACQPFESATELPVLVS